MFYNNTKIGKFQQLNDLFLIVKEIIVKFLHTADWNLAIRTNGKSRLDEQRNVLEEILSIANFEGVDCIIVCGNVFAASNPPAEAEQLFYDMICKLAGGGQRFVLVLSGNHDNPKKIRAMLPLSVKENIALVGDLGALDISGFNPAAEVKVIETGEGYVKLQKQDETAVLAYLPFPTKARIDKTAEGETYSENVKVWASEGAAAFSEESFNIFCSHLLLKGADNGRGVVGDEILATTLDYLPHADYTALGHIAIAQSVGENAFYSGSIISLSPKAEEPSVNIIETENGKLEQVRTVKLKNPVKYERVCVSGVSEAEKVLQSYDEKDIVELEITSGEILSSAVTNKLRADFPCISTITLSGRKLETRPLFKENFLNDDKSLFEEFYKKNFNAMPSEGLTDAFLKCIGDENETD